MLLDYRSYEFVNGQIDDGRRQIDDGRGQIESVDVAMANWLAQHQ